MQFEKYLKAIVVLEESELPGTSTVATKRNAFETMAKSGNVWKLVESFMIIVVTQPGSVVDMYKCK